MGNVGVGAAGCAEGRVCTEKEGDEFTGDRSLLSPFAGNSAWQQRAKGAATALSLNYYSIIFMPASFVLGK